MTRTVKVRGKFCTIHTTAVSDFHVAWCMETDTSQAGDTEGSAVSGLVDQLEAHFERLERAAIRNTPAHGTPRPVINR